VALGLLDSASLIEVMLARYRWIEWRLCRDQINFDRDADGQELQPDELVNLTMVNHELRLLWRIADTVSDGTPVFLELWRQILQLCLKESVATVGPPKEKHARAESNNRLHGELSQLGQGDDTYWLQVARAAGEGSVLVSWSHPEKGIQSLCEEAIAEAQLDLGRRKVGTVVRELFLENLDESVMEERSRFAREALITQACRDYEGMLNAEAVYQYPVGGVFIGNDKQRVGLAILDKRGKVTTTAPVRPSGDWPQRVCRWLTDNRVRVAVLPSSALSAQWLAVMDETLKESEMDYLSVSPAGLIVARGADDPVLRSVSPEIASAIVLARRAMKPIEAWSQVEPGKLGLVPMTAQVEEARLNETLMMVRERCIAECQPTMTTPVGSGSIRQRANAPLNPMVRGIRDLRPGLSLNGVVSNVTKFGAFVNVGVRQEGLVHISELSNEFVEDPNEVIQVGQQVQVRVISVDLERGRIALSMRSEGSMPASAGGRGSLSSMAAGGPPRPRTRDGAGRSQALQNLESLFRKSSDGELETGTDSDTVSDSSTASDAESDSSAVSEAVSDSESETDAESDSSAASEAVSDSESETDAESDSESATDL
jgi:predicted RNA-binding protein with RPS1 domain